MKEREITGDGRRQFNARSGIDRLMRLLDLLSEEQRLVTVLHLRDDLSFAEIASRTASTPEEVRRHYYAALRKVSESRVIGASRRDR